MLITPHVRKLETRPTTVVSRREVAPEGELKNHSSSPQSLNARPALCQSSIFVTYAIGDAPWKNGFDDDAGATAADDAESKTAAIVDKIDHFNLSPFRIQLRKKRSQRRLKSCPFVKKFLIILLDVPPFSRSPEESDDVAEFELSCPAFSSSSYYLYYSEPIN